MVTSVWCSFSHGVLLQDFVLLLFWLSLQCSDPLLGSLLIEEQTGAADFTVRVWLGYECRVILLAL